jgi:uncharacterized delta-60 repeat protein
MALGLLAGALVVAVGSAEASTAVLDPSFAAGTGMLFTAIGSSAAADAVALQADGKIVAAGGVVQADNSQDFAVTRYEANGVLDPTFGSGGIVQAPAGTARAVAVQPDGKIVAAGTDFSHIRVVRYDADGSLDPSFGSGGVVTTPVGTGAADASAILLQPDGKIVVGGESSVGLQTVFTLVRYDTNGSLDPTFGGGGVVTTAVGAGDSAVKALVLQPDGKIVADGDAVGAASEGVPGLVRYNTDGSLDATFGNGGIVTTHVGVGGASASTGPLALQPDGKLVVVVGFSLVRYGADGTLDPTFGAATTFAGTFGPTASGLALQPDGKILVVGSEPGYSSTQSELLRLVRFSTSGVLDGTFANFGGVFFGAWAGANGNPPPPPRPAIALQPDGKVVVAGSHSDDGGATQQFLLARFGASTVTVKYYNLAGPNQGAGGNISSSPAGIDCTYSCFYTTDHFVWEHGFAAGPVTLTATPWEGYLFAGWSGDGCSGTGTCTVQMSGDPADDQTVDATFVPAPTKELTVTKAGTGAGLITTSGLYCRRHCAHGFVEGSTVTLHAQATSNWSRFIGWSGDCSGKGDCTVTMDKSHAVTATFQHFCIVPRLKGKTLRIARLRARAAHCSVGKVRPVSSAVKKGRVVSQKPAAGRRLLGRSRVRLEISKGMPRRR